MNHECTINSRKGDGQIHRSWRAQLLHESDELLIFEGIFEREVRHDELGVIRPGTVSLEYYWPRKTFNVFRFTEPTGELRCFYCNVNLPPTFDANTLDYVDLDIDILWTPGEDPRVLDLHEFESNSIRFGYDEATVRLAHSATQELLEMIARGNFPFDRFKGL